MVIRVSYFADITVGPVVQYNTVWRCTGYSANNGCYQYVVCVKWRQSIFFFGGGVQTFICRWRQIDISHSHWSLRHEELKMESKYRQRGGVIIGEGGIEPPPWGGGIEPLPPARRSGRALWAPPNAFRHIRAQKRLKLWGGEDSRYFRPQYFLWGGAIASLVPPVSTPLNM